VTAQPDRLFNRSAISADSSGFGRDIALSPRGGYVVEEGVDGPLRAFAGDRIAPAQPALERQFPSNPPRRRLVRLA